MDEPAPLKGLVLAGGSSRRMGSDKALLELEGVPLLARAVALLRSLLDDVRVAVRPDQVNSPARSSYPVIEDYPGLQGPAAGILGAHAAEPQYAWLVIACDMPLLDSNALRCLIEGRDGSMDATALAVAPGADPEPLCAIYEPVTLAAFLARAGAGNLSPRHWLKTVKVRLLLPPDTSVLLSANTGEDFQRISERLRERAILPSGAAGGDKR